MALTSMRLTPEERRDEAPSTVAADDGPLYPWGLTLHLDDTVLEKLGLEGLPSVGAEFLRFDLARIPQPTLEHGETVLAGRESGFL